jgi:hypothetical protein
MDLSYYDMQKLMRMVYDQKLSDSKEDIVAGRRRAPDFDPPSKRLSCRVLPAGSAAK